jgi:ribosomal protein L14E/L6E/L27E
MIYSKFVEIGRVAFIAKGKDEQKLAVIVDVVDGNRVGFTLHINFTLFDV